MTIKDGNLNTLKCQIWKKKTPPNFCKLTPLSVKFEKNNATKFLQVNTLKCQIWKKNATKILQVNTLKCQIWKKKRHHGSTLKGVE